MNPKPIDSHCHLFSARYVVEEAAAMGWAYVTGNYPHAEAVTKAEAAESLFSWSRLEDIVKWFFDLGAALSSYETNYQSLLAACRRGLNLPAGEELVVAPLMMDIFYMFGTPAGGPAQGVKTGRAVGARKRRRDAKDQEASEEAFERFQGRVTALAVKMTLPKAKARPAGVYVALKAERPAAMSAAEIDRIFREAKSKKRERGVMRGLSAGREISRGFKNQIESLIGLQERHAGEVFPFFAVDPRRRGIVDMAIRGIPELNDGRPLVTPRGPFFGVKLYTRLGYLPADVPEEMYRYCETHQIPVIVHTSGGGFPPGSDWQYADYATPDHWRTVLEKHPSLRLDFAHFGSGDPSWTRQILELMSGYPNVYADLACYTESKEREEAWKIWSQGGIVRERLLFGTDFVVSSLTKILSLEGYFSAFQELFGPADLESLMKVNTRKFLQPILPEALRIRPERTALVTVPPAEEKLRRKLGWLPDLPDHRDHDMETDSVPRHLQRLNRTQTVKTMMGQITGGVSAEGRKKDRGRAAALPTSVDLRQWCSPIEDQGDLGACTAHAAAALIEYYERRAFGSYIDISRLFLYKATRNLLNWTGDTGAYLRTTMEAMVLFGVPPEEYFPYDPANVDVEPSAFCYSFAQNYQTLTYFRLDAARTTRPELLRAIKTNLSRGVPAMFGFTVFGSIGSAAKTGRIPFPVKTDRREGGHAVAAVGYDDNLVIRHPYSDVETKGAILIRNSWGNQWGEAGCGWLPYEYVLHHLAIDWWTVLKQEWVDTRRFQEP